MVVAYIRYCSFDGKSEQGARSGTAVWHTVI